MSRGASRGASHFYAELPVLTEFSAVTQVERFQPLPADWHVAACDIRNSTHAVRAGDYKEVNTVAAAAVSAVLNAAGEVDIPFIFEGDGSAFCVPPALLEDVRAALAKTRDMARASFGFDLRVATVPVARVRAAGFDILVARYQVSENYVQAVFAGGGMAWAERYMKDPASAGLCAVGAEVAPRGSHEGLECRWQDIPSPHGETVSLIVRAAEGNPVIYREVIAKVAEIYGSDEQCHPLTLPALSMTLSGRRLDNEVGVRAAGHGAWGRWRYRTWIRLVIVLGWVLMKLGVRTEQTDWSRYKSTLVRNSDVRKFNDVYRQILAGNAAQREALAAWLEQRYARRELAYGMHVTDRAHMTCLVFDYSGRHLHFIDGADGGLFAASSAFKERAAQLAR
jgi:hypothetical protein